MNKIFLCISILIMAVACKNQQQFSGMHQPSRLNGGWQLNYISGPRIAFEGLYPNRIPELVFEVETMKVHGNTGCNNLNGKFEVNKGSINLNGPFATTRMMCQGQGEQLFLETLKKVDAYEVDDTTLTLLMGDVAIMRFVKKE